MPRPPYNPEADEPFEPFRQIGLHIIAVGESVAHVGTIIRHKRESGALDSYARDLRDAARRLESLAGRMEREGAPLDDEYRLARGRLAGRTYRR